MTPPPKFRPTRAKDVRLTDVFIIGANRGIDLTLATRFAVGPDPRVIATTRDAANASDLEALAARVAR